MRNTTRPRPTTTTAPVRPGQLATVTGGKTPPNPLKTPPNPL
jgi:hypothetical protein